MASKRKCSTPYCRKNVDAGTICSTCRSRKLKRENPLYYHFNALKQNAKRRKKEFKLTFDEWCLFWLVRHVQWNQRLEGIVGWEVDRIDNNKPYQFDNIQLLTKVRNVRKYYDQDRYTVDAIYVTVTETQTDAPF